MPIRIIRCTTLALLIGCVISPALAAAKTCLVLSGGGARGAAHVGVLKALEELRVPVDCIVGTSMGAVVGGLYATGMSPGRIEQEMLGADWPDLFDDSPPRSRKPFRRKQDDRVGLFDFEVGVSGKGFALPKGVIGGQKLDFMLKTLTLEGAPSGRFDDLAIPFRAVATDLETGNVVVLDSGNLADAIRASMAVPGAFPPVELDGRWLVDGGITRNIPVDVARDTGADRLIVVDVSAPPPGIEDVRTVLGVTLQTLNLLIDQNVEAQRALIDRRDVVIAPEFGDLGSTRFGRVEEAAVLGEQATLDRAAVLDPFIATPAEFDAYRGRLRSARRVLERPVRIGAVEVAGARRVDPRIVIRKLTVQPGDELDVDTLRSDLQRVYELGDFERVTYTVLRDPAAGSATLRIETIEKSWGPSYLRPGLHLFSDLKGRGEFSVIGDLTTTRINRLGGEWKNRVSIGTDNRLLSELYQPLSFGQMPFVAPRVEVWSTRSERIDADGDSVPLDEDGFEAAVDFGLAFGNWGELRLGAAIGRTGFEVPDVGRSDTGYWRARFQADRLDHVAFPTRGVLVEVEARWSRDGLGAADVYDRLEASVTAPFRFGRNTFVFDARYGTPFGSMVPFRDEFTLGGFLDLSGYGPGALSGQALTRAQLVYYRPVMDLPSAFGRAMLVGAAIQAGNVWDDPDDASLGDLIPAWVAFLGLDTRFGPMYLGYGRNRDGFDSAYLVMGRTF